MVLENEFGLVIYTIDVDKIHIDWIEVDTKRLGCGTKLLNQIKAIASELNLSIHLYSFPLTNKISEKDLRKFYIKNGFKNDPEDLDLNMFFWEN